MYPKLSQSDTEIVVTMRQPIVNLRQSGGISVLVLYINAVSYSLSGIFFLPAISLHK
jgi:hypothetical protein